jgi:Flp pilus assembly protein TadG
MEERILNSDMEPIPRPTRKVRRSNTGQALIEFTFTIIPFLLITTFLVSMAWDFFVIANLQQAVRMGVRTGITITGTQAKTGSPTGGASDLTSMIKNAVQSNAQVPVSTAPCTGTTIFCLSVKYYNPPDPNWAPVGGSTPPALVLTANPNAATGDLVVVRVQGMLSPLVPIMLLDKGSGFTANTSSVVVPVTSADLFEACSADCPPLGVWP